MLSAGGDNKLAGLFANAEIKRTFCGQRSPILAATPEREAQLGTTPRNARLHPASSCADAKPHSVIGLRGTSRAAECA